MNKQITLTAFNDELARVRTKKKEFLAQMDRIIPWDEWKALIQPSYYTCIPAYTRMRLYKTPAQLLSLGYRSCILQMQLGMELRFQNTYHKHA